MNHLLRLLHVSISVALCSCTVNNLAEYNDIPEWGIKTPVRPEPAEGYPFRNTSLTWEDRVEDLVARLTLEEIVPQTWANYHHPTPAIPRLGIKPYVWITECLRGQMNTNTTSFPQALGLASTFSQSLIYEVAEAVSKEVRAHWNGLSKIGKYKTDFGLSCFSPVINIVRHPYWGRNQETYGEDPFLSGSLAQSYVRGLQGGHPRYVRANAGCKHFDVYAGPENIPVSRHKFDAKVSMRDWRMTFLPQFKMCVDAGTWNLMCSYNSVRGIPACAHKELLTDILRKEWGFKGYVISDANAILNIQQDHKYINNSVDVTTACIKAGCNLELASNFFQNQLEALKQGKLSEAEIRENVKPLFMMRMRLGEFDPPYMNPYTKIDNSEIQSPAHRQLALKAAMKSFVLMKNDNNILPLKTKYKNIAVVGPFGNKTDQVDGDYDSQVNPKFTSYVAESMRQISPSVTFASGCKDVVCAHYNASEVISAAADKDLVLVALGTGQKVEMEGRDRSSLNLPGHQLNLLKDAVKAASGAPVILVLYNAGPLDITWAKSQHGVAAILECYFPAQSTGEALYRVLTSTGGDSVPAARLPVTWPASEKQIPPMINYTMVGRTYRYFIGDPLYPFGYGLSYTTFQYSDLSVSPSKIGPGEAVSVTVSVQNTGKYDADEVVQIYMSWRNETVPVPRLQLAGFRRVPVNAGELVSLTFRITPEQMSVWISDQQGWGILTGSMTVYAGGQQPNQSTKISSNILRASFMVTE